MSKLALKLIAENKRTRSPFLDLGNCGLTEVPIEIGELVWLEELSFAHERWSFNGNIFENKISQNPEQSNQIKQLVSTHFSMNELVNNKLDKSNPFLGLVNLKKLFLNGSYAKNFSFEDLSPLSCLTNLQSLDISHTQVSDLSHLSVLVNLKQLITTNTHVTNLSPLSNLSNLELLYFANTQVIDLSPLSNLSNLKRLYVVSTPVTDLSPLLGLTNLYWLDISATKVTDLSALSGLIQLQRLHVSSNQVTDLSPLTGLKNLQWLKFPFTHIADLSPISDLISLQEIDFQYTQVSDLSPISGLKNIQRINLSCTPVIDLSPLLELIKNGIAVKWSSNSWKGDGIYIEGCPLLNPPVEIAKRGNVAILNYFNAKQTQGTAKLYEAKMLLIGEGGAGKTSLMQRLYQPEKPTLPEEDKTTKGIAIHRHDFIVDDQHSFRLNVWDFGGQEIYHATHQFFLTKRSLYVLLDDTRKDDKSVHDPSFKYWLEVADLLGEHSPVLIFQNEKGGRSKTIDESGIKAKFPNVKDVYRGNLESPTAADSIRKAVEYFAQNLPHIGEDLPARWVGIRADIEQQAQEKSFISQQDYFDIYSQHLEFDREKALHLSRYFHDLGVFLHFQDEPLLARTVILQNTWATEAVFKMLDDETVKAKLGHFERADCQRVWQDSMYADMHPELLALMQKFELCYRLPDMHGDNWLAPQLLPPSKPAALSNWQQVSDLTLRYRYEFLPKGMISRLIVRMHRFVLCPDLSWISGALFERDGTTLLAEVPAKGGEIVLRARGPERKELLSVISADLEAMNESFHGLKDLVSKWIPCCCSSCNQLTEPEFFKQERLLQRKRDGKLKVECPGSYADVDVLEMLDGVQIRNLPAWAKQKSEAHMQTIKIFLASSAELKEDRDAFDLYFRQENDKLLEQGIYLKIVRWENFLDAMSATRLQDEYNKEVIACDIFVSLFFSKTGKYTEDEFNTAHRQFQNAGKPQIYTFFKNAPQNMGDIGDEILTLLNFKKKLADLGHFYTSYDNIEHLKRQFKDQLEKLREIR